MSVHSVAHNKLGNDQRHYDELRSYHEQLQPVYIYIKNNDVDSAQTFTKPDEAIAQAKSDWNQGVTVRAVKDGKSGKMIVQTTHTVTQVLVKAVKDGKDLFNLLRRERDA